MRRALIVLSVAASALLAAAPAESAFPGANGKIAFVTENPPPNGTLEISTINADGTNQTQLTNNADTDSDPAWSPDGTKIAFFSDRDAPYGIYTMNADGTNPTRLNPSNRVASEPTWAPDGSKIAFTDGLNNIRTINADGTNEAQITTTGYSDDAAWSPDGTKIAFARLSPSESYEIYVMNADGSNPTRLTITAQDVSNGSPNWSPDGTKIAFTSNRDDPNPATCFPCNYEIYVMNADGTSQTRLTNNAAADAHPAWSPDGTKIAFARGALYTMNADGTNQTPITDPAFTAIPDWQPIPLNYARPKGASPTQVFLVPAYAQCTGSGNRTHGAPLAFPSCAPPAQTSGTLTVGTPDANGAAAKSIAKVVYAARPGDLAIAATISDVRKKLDLSDYTGELSLASEVRITDRYNTPSPGGPGPATVADTTIPVTIPCAATADTTVGSSCDLATTIDSLYPGAITAGRRSIWQLGQVKLHDGGLDGAASTTADNTLFMDQGLFVP